VKKGAWAIDVNTGPLDKIPEKGMVFFIEAVQSVTDLPLLIDTSNPAAMKAGVSQERIIIDPVVPPLAWEDGIIQARAVLNNETVNAAKASEILSRAELFSWGMVSG
jgi:hypothetical protein